MPDTFRRTVVRALLFVVLVIAVVFLIGFWLGYATHGDGHSAKFRFSVDKDSHAIADPVLPVRLRLVWLRGERPFPGIELADCLVDSEHLPGTFRVPQGLGSDQEGQVSITTLTCGRAVYGVEGIDFSR